MIDLFITQLFFETTVIIPYYFDIFPLILICININDYANLACKNYAEPNNAFHKSDIYLSQYDKHISSNKRYNQKNTNLSLNI